MPLRRLAPGPDGERRGDFRDELDASSVYGGMRESVIGSARESSVPARAMEDRFAATYVRHAPGAIRFAHVLTADEHAAEELVQDAFVKVYARSRRAEAPEAFASYLRRTILNEWRSRRRREQLWRSFARKSPPTTVTDLPDVASSADLWAAIRRLPARQRAAIHLRYYEDMPIAAVAATLECSEAAARSLLAHAMHSLRKSIRKGAP